MQPLIRQVHTRLLLKEKTVAVAESCTGGMLACRLTSLPDSSGYFVLGVVVYSNRSKSSLLNIPSSLISSRGAVSREVASMLSDHVRKLAHADFGIGITGIAGPGGGSKQKPVGTVFVSLSTSSRTVVKRCFFKGSRSAIREQAVRQALTMLDRSLR
ncbi:MAG TPA: CinA family protein [Candidatus Omnitrophota bacterium]|nr:CinA family protein [Candidatus Omnitrophota bacterium]HRZ14458.1 CinA family protein [Candidatus Omnitrophota bacterium]